MRLAEQVRPLTGTTSRSAASHETAAELWEMPQVWESPDMLHISRPTTFRSPRRRGVRGHQTSLLPDEVVHLDGLSLTSRERTWLDLASTLNVDQLVILADHLIRVPRPWYENRWEAYTTAPSLKARSSLHRGKPGIRKARAALELARVGADSPQETRLRLAICRSGLPEPGVNVPLKTASGALNSADLSYFRYKISIEYEGDHHRTPEQMASDIRRDEAVTRAGWVQIRISKSDMNNGAARAVARIRRALLEQGWKP